MKNGLTQYTAKISDQLSWWGGDVNVRHVSFHFNIFSTSLPHLAFQFIQGVRLSPLNTESSICSQPTNLKVIKTSLFLIESRNLKGALNARSPCYTLTFIFYNALHKL